MTRSENGLVVIDNLATALDAIDGLIVIAGDEDRPGLEKAAAVIKEMISASDDPRVQWVRQVLLSAGVDAAADYVGAARVLRARARGLNVLEAGILAKRVAGGGVE